MVGQLLFPKEMVIDIEDYPYAFMIATPDIIQEGKAYRLEYKRGWGNGYVALKRDHPLFNAPKDIVDASVITHHGITFAELDRINELFIIGFHTNYPGDTKQSAPKEYVLEQTRNLYRQLYGPGWD